MKTIKNNKGISLITLIITIIVIIILAGVVIFNLTDRNLADSAKETVIYSDASNFKSELSLSIINKSLESLGVSSSPNLEGEEILEYVPSMEAKKIDGVMYTDILKVENGSLVLNENISLIKSDKTKETLKKVYNDLYGKDTSKYTSTKMEIFGNSVKIKAKDKGVKIKGYSVLVDGTEYKNVLTDSTSTSINIEDTFGKILNITAKVMYDDNTEEITESTSLKNEDKIYTAKDIENFRDSVNAGNDYYDKTITLVNNIDLKGSETNQWVPIGTKENNFAGKFNGNNNSIKGLYINSKTDEQKYSALFGYLATKYEQGLLEPVLSEVKNLKVYGNVTANGYVAGIVAYSYGYKESIFLNLTNYVNIEGSGNSVGGALGYVWLNYQEKGDNIKNIINYGDIKITGNIQNAGGVAGGLFSSDYRIIDGLKNYGKISLKER